MGGWVDGVEEQTGQQGFERNKNDSGWMGGWTDLQENEGAGKGYALRSNCVDGANAWYLSGWMARGRSGAEQRLSLEQLCG